ncbi:SgcJ/EcaC family oxidoreductase [Nocardia panacis]|uniref:SgcJ/EcaC family oxidoreductase n=1 Tax=Nocardia panacis TaxID=2340916 RepID=A0A3A4K7V3_9NOCA|nr:SgcJ/EcaC family oxidoreductase [Nocardia panacis]RJO70777.1 SgcJ/EcaC family oxidoreductase [Nocardia panacis]
MSSSNSAKPIATEALSIDDERAIRDLVARADRSQADAAALPGLHTDTTAIVNFYGRRILGRDTVEAAMNAALSSGLGAVRTSVEVIDIRPLTGDTALVSCIKTVYDERPAAEQVPPTTGALTYVTVRTPAGWKIGLAQTTPIVSD